MRKFNFELRITKNKKRSNDDFHVPMGWCNRAEMIELLCQCLFFNKVCNFIKKDTLAQVFSREFCKISKNPFFHRTPLVAASMLNLLTNIIAKNQPAILDMMSWEFYVMFQKDKLHENGMIYLTASVWFHQYAVQI